MANFVERVRAIHIGDRYTLIHLLGEGSCGKVYLGRDTENESEVAIKLEHYSIGTSLLDEEVRTYEILESQPGFARVFWHGWQNTFRVMVFELLGPNLEDLLQYCGGKFSLKTTLMLFDQLLHRFESLHNAGFLYRDVKPENFLLGTGENGNTVYMTDLGLAAYRYDLELYEKSKTGMTDAGLVGTCRYASVRGHLGVYQTGRDDLEALGYMMVNFAKGSLPWQGLKASSRSKYHLVLKMKQNTTAEQLCQGLPSAFTTYFRYLSSRAAVKTLDYGHLRKLLRAVSRQEGWEYDFVFDWTIIEFNRQQSTGRASDIVIT